jgi:selenocysteine-specific elongation factor
MGARGEALLFDRERRSWVSGEVARELQQRMVAAVEAFHATQPLAAGMGREELRGRLPPVTDARLFQRLLQHLADRGDLELSGDLVRRKGHAAGTAGSGGALKERVAAALRAGGRTPPWTHDLPAAVGGAAADVAAVLKLLVADGAAVRVTPDLYFDAAVVEELRTRLVAHLRAHGGISTQEFKDLVGATRKHVIPLAEYFDREKVTLRVGERRVLRGAGGGA